MFADPVPLSDMPACTVQLYQTCMLGSFIQIRMFVKCCSTRLDIWSVTNPSDMPTGRVSSHRFVKLVSYYPGSHLEYEPVHEISNNVVCATSKASDQPAHKHSLLRTFASRLSIL